MVEVVRGIPLQDAPFAHDPDLLAAGERLELVVGDQDAGDLTFLENLPDLDTEPFAQVGVETRERLIHQQQVGARRDRPGQCDTLLLTARQLVRVTAAVAAETDQFEHRRSRLAPHLGQQAAQAEADVVGDVEVRKQRVVLEHHADPALLGGDGPPRDRDRLAAQPDVAGMNRLEAGDSAQDGGLAAAARPEQADETSPADMQGRVVYDGLATVAAIDICNLEQGHRRISANAGSSW